MEPTPIDPGVAEIAAWRATLERQISENEHDEAERARLLGVIGELAATLLREYHERQQAARLRSRRRMEAASPTKNSS